MTYFSSVPVGVWLAQSTTGSKPPAFDGHTFITINDHKAVLFGGSGGKKYNDTYVLDLDTWVWSVCVRENFQITDIF